MTKLLEESVTLPPDMPEKAMGYPLYITAKRYFVAGCEAYEGDKDALTVLALHSTSFHKETWEPMLEALFERGVGAGAGRVKIREVWGVDCPNHGRAGVLNREVLKTDVFADNFGCEHYATAVHRFLMHGQVLGVDFGKRRLIGLGHSLGANTLLLLQWRVPRFPFLSLIIVEPMVSPDGAHHLDKLRRMLVESAKTRVSEWPDRETAFKELKCNRRTAKWDERVLRTFVNHAIVPSADGVILACTREQEVAMYQDIEGATKPVEALNWTCSRLPIHIVLGSQIDFIPRHVHDALLDPASGRRYASVKHVLNVGHLIPQQVPKELGKIVHDVLTSIVEPSPRL